MIDVKEKFPKAANWFGKGDLVNLDFKELKKGDPKLYKKLMQVITENDEVTVGFNDHMYPVCYLVVVQAAGIR